MRLNKWQEVVLTAVTAIALFAACVVVMVIGLIIMVSQPVWWGMAGGFVICCVAVLLAFTLGYSVEGWVLARWRQHQLARNQQGYEAWLAQQRADRTRALQQWLREMEREDTEQDAA